MVGVGVDGDVLAAFLFVPFEHGDEGFCPLGVNAEHAGVDFEDELAVYDGAEGAAHGRFYLFGFEVWV